MHIEQMLHTRPHQSGVKRMPRFACIGRALNPEVPAPIKSIRIRYDKRGNICYRYRM